LHENLSPTHSRTLTPASDEIGFSSSLAHETNDGAFCAEIGAQLKPDASALGSTDGENKCKEGSAP
jgi:hypothetical protein